jgi:hypothetical protein
MFKPARKFTTVSAALLVSGALVFSLSGCFSNPLESVIEDGLGVNVEDSGTSIPADFPKAVPLFDGPVKEGSSLKMGDVKTWTVVIGMNSLDEADLIEQKLKDAGIDGFWTKDDVSAGGLLGSDDYGVVVNVANEDGGWQVTYLVTEASETK